MLLKREQAPRSLPQGGTSRGSQVMSREEIIAELPKLKPEERQEVRLRLAELDGENWLDEGELTDAEKALIEERFLDFEANPQTSIPWEEAKARLIASLKR